MKYIFLFFFISILINVSHAQVKRLKYIGIEAGMTFIESKMSDLDFVRGEIPSYSAGYSTNTLTSTTYKSLIGVKAEIFSLNDRFSLIAGVRFSRISKSIGKNNYWSNNSNYFYCLSLQDGVNTEYLKVKEINQISDYLGIPLELKYFTSKRPHKFRIYLKMGAEINYLLQTKTDIVFNDITMNFYQKDLIAKIRDPKTFYSSIYGGGGVRLGRDFKPSVSIEGCIPFLFLSSKSFGLVNPIWGGGFQFNLQIPIK